MAPKNDRLDNELKRSGRNPQISVLLMPADHHELDYLQEELGVGKAEAIRTAIRVYAGLLRQSNKGR